MRYGVIALAELEKFDTERMIKRAHIGQWRACRTDQRTAWCPLASLAPILASPQALRR